MSEEVDYLDALMKLFIKSPHVSPSLKTQIQALRKARDADVKTDEIAIPVKMRKITEEDLEMFEEE